MLEPIRHILAKQRIVLASGSPRRRQLLESVGLNFEVIISNFREDLEKESFSHPCEYVKENAKRKAIEVWNRLSGVQDSQLDLVIGADTVVTMEEVIYEKPVDKEDAFNILTKLSGQKHTVFSGVCLLTKSPATPSSSAGQVSSGDTTDEGFVVTTFHEATDVFMSQMSANIIKSYIETGEPMDKAGAYGIQGVGGTLIEGVKGDFYNVIGIPLHRLCKELYYIYME